MLLITAEIGDLKQVRDLIHKGADVNHEDFVYVSMFFLRKYTVKFWVYW